MLLLLYLVKHVHAHMYKWGIEIIKIPCGMSMWFHVYDEYCPQYCNVVLCKPSPVVLYVSPLYLHTVCHPHVRNLMTWYNPEGPRVTWKHEARSLKLECHSVDCYIALRIAALADCTLAYICPHWTATLATYTLSLNKVPRYKLGQSSRLANNACSKSIIAHLCVQLGICSCLYMYIRWALH